MLQLALDRLAIICGPVKQTNLDFVYHISALTTHEEVKEFGKSLARHHATELRNAALEFGLRNFLNEPIDVIDIGCGHGLSCYALREIGVGINSFQGYDHNPFMVEDARRIAIHLEDNSMFPRSVEFSTRLANLLPVSKPCLVIMNHVLKQRSVNSAVLKAWSDELDRLTPGEFLLMNLDSFSSTREHPSPIERALHGDGRCRTNEILIRGSTKSESDFRATKDVEFIQFGRTQTPR